MELNHVQQEYTFRTTEEKTYEKKEEKRMKKNSEKPSTLTAALYIIGLIICGYFIVKAIVTF